MTQQRLHGAGASPHAPAGGVTDLTLGAGSLTDSWLTRWSADDAHRTLHDDALGWISAAELEERSRAVASRFVSAGLSPGDRIIISTASSVEAVIAYVGAVRAGLVVVPVNTAYREPEIAHIVRDSAPRAAVVDDRDRGRWMEAASTDHIVVTGVDVNLPVSTAGDLPAQQADAPALLIYTSGTTGVPKGALLSHGNLIAGAEALRVAWQWSPQDGLLHTLPLFHLHGLGVGVNASLHAGAAIKLRSRFDPVDVLDRAADPDVSMYFGVPTMYGRLATQPDLAALGGLRLCVSGSAPLPEQLFHQIEALSGHTILERYGMTETMLTVSNPYEGERRAGTVGFPLPGVELRLGENDEVEVRGPMIFGGYWQRPEATAASFSADGWFRTGDVGSFDNDSYLRIVGRMKEVIITGGYNVYPREVEEALLGHPAVSEVAVTGQPSDDWGEAVVAWVVADTVSGQELIDFARSRLAPYKCPKAVRLVASLPRSPLGKVLKHKLV